MGIFNRAIPNIQTNNLNQVRVVPQEDYYVDDIFDPLFNAKVKEQLTLKYGNPFLGVVGGYMEGIDNALIGQDDKWGILGPGMGILSGFGRSMDKAGDFIIGGVTEGVKGLTGQGFENPLRNIFVEDEDYTGTRLLAAMGNSMAGLAKAPQLNESDFKGLWNIPAMGLELATDPGILGGGIKKAASVNLGEQVAKQSANSHLADVGQLLMDYDDFMAKVSIDITAPGLRLGAKTLLDKIWQMLGNSSARPWAEVLFNRKETPEARAQAASNIQKDERTRQLLALDSNVRKVKRDIDLNAAQAAFGTATAVPSAIQEELNRNKAETFHRLVEEAREGERNIIRRAYEYDLAQHNANVERVDTAVTGALDDFRKNVDSDMLSAGQLDSYTLDRARALNLNNVSSPSLLPDIPEDQARINFENYEKLQDAMRKISLMEKEDLNALNINPEYVEQVDLNIYDNDAVAAGLFYDFVPNPSTRNAIARYAGVDLSNLKGIQLPTPITFSPGDFLGLSNATLGKGVSVAQALLYRAFESAGIPLQQFKNADALRKALLDEKSPHAQAFQTAFPSKDMREHVANVLSTLVFPQEYAKDFKTGAVSYLNRLNDFSNEIIAYSKLRETKHVPQYTEVLRLADAAGVSPLDYLTSLKDNLSFTDWELRKRYDSNFIDDISALENLYDISEDDTFIDALRRGAELSLKRQSLYDAFDNAWYEDAYLAQGKTLSLINAREKLPHPHTPADVGQELLARIDNVLGRESRLTHESVTAQIQNLARVAHKEMQVAELGYPIFKAEVDRIFKQALSEDDLQALSLIDAARLHNPENVSKILDDLKDYEETWTNLVSEHVLASNTLQSTLWHNMQDMADTFQREVYAPFKRKAPVGYVQSTLGYKDQGHAVDLYGTRAPVQMQAPTQQEVLASKHVRGERVAAAKEAAENSKAKPQSNSYIGSKKYYKNLRNDFGKRDVGYAGGGDTYQYHRTLTNLFRKDARGFKNVKDFKILRKEILPQLTKNNEAKLVPEFFFGEGSAKLRRTDLPKNPFENEVANFILQEGDDVVRAFETEVKPVAEALLKDGVLPFADPDKFSPRIDLSIGHDAAWFNRVVKNQRAMQYLLGYGNSAHAYAKQFRVIADTLPAEYSTRTFKYLLEPTPEFLDTYAKEISSRRAPVYIYKPNITLNHLTVEDYVKFQNVSFAADWKRPVKVPDVRRNVSRILTETPPKTKTTFKSTEGLTDKIIANIQDAPAKQAAESIVDFPTYNDAVKTKVMDEVGIPEYAQGSKDTYSAPSGGENPSSGPVKDADDILTPKKFKSLKDLINGAVTRMSRAYSKKDATLRTKYVEKILESADILMGKGTSLDDIAKYKRVQVYLGGAAVRKEEFLDTLASSGTFLMAYKPTEDFTKTFDMIRQNVSEVNVAMKANVLKPIQFKLPNGNTVIGAMWDTSNEKVLNDVAKGYKNVDVSKLKDIVRLEKGTVNSSMEAYMRSAQYREIDELFNNTRQQEAEFAKLQGFKYDDVYHVKNVIRRGDVEVADYLKNVIYKDIPTSDLDNISDKMMELDVFKHLRGAWGSRRFDKRFIGYIEDFETNGLRIFEDDASRIVRGSFADGSFNNAKFQLYIDLFDNDNFRVSTYFKTPEDLERVLYARTADGKSSGNLANLVLAAPKLDDTGRIIGFTQFDKTTRTGLQRALNNPNTVLLPAHVFSPLDKVLRKDAKMSNKVYAFIHKHLTLPFKFGVLMNPGFLLGNMSDAYLKQATTMANKYGTSVPEELANVSVAIKDVLTLNNRFDDAYRRFLAHVQAEGFTIAPSNQISSLAASDLRIRKMLKDYVNNKLQHGMGRPIIACELSSEERNVVKLWMLLNSPSTGATFEKGLQDLDIIAKAKNNSKYQMPKNAFNRILTGKGEYLADDVSTWGLFANNPLSRAVMDSSEAIENTVRAACILNDFRHKGMDAEWFKEYFDSLDELSAASAAGDFNSAAYKEQIKKNFNVDMSEAINTMHSANFDYERMTDFTDAVGTAVPFPTFFLKNLGYWLEILVNNPQYIDHAITVQESLWGSRDTSKDQFAAEAKGRGAIPVSAGGQNLSKFFKGIYKPTPLQSMFGAFTLMNSPVEDMYYRLHPALSSGIAAASQVEPLKSIAADVLPSESVKYRPYSTDMYERNVKRGDPNFNPLAYSIHRANPLERATQSIIRLPDKLRNDQAQLSDFLPSIFQPDFGEKYSQ